MHVAGKRMMVQCTDGVSRGSLREGVGLGESMLKFCPWGKSALDSEVKLKEWIQTWAPVDAIMIFLEHKDWFIRGMILWIITRIPRDIGGPNMNLELMYGHPL